MKNTIVEDSKALFKQLSEVGQKRINLPQEEFCSQEEAEALGSLVALAIVFIGQSNTDKVLKALDGVIDEVVAESKVETCGKS